MAAADASLFFSAGLYLHGCHRRLVPDLIHRFCFRQRRDDRGESCCGTNTVSPPLFLLYLMFPYYFLSSLVSFSSLLVRTFLNYLFYWHSYLLFPSLSHYLFPYFIHWPLLPLPSIYFFLFYLPITLCSIMYFNDLCFPYLPRIFTIFSLILPSFPSVSFVSLFFFP